MEQYQFKVKYPFKDPKSGQMKNVVLVGIANAITYGDTEATCNSLMEKLSIIDFAIGGITKPKQCEIIGTNRPEEREDEDHWWWKIRVVYITESDKGKVNTNYHHYIVYTDTAKSAVEIATEAESKKAMIGDVDKVDRTDITHFIYE